MSKFSSVCWATVSMSVVTGEVRAGTSVGSDSAQGNKDMGVYMCMCLKERS
jgi:hypothetical protein